MQSISDEVGEGRCRCTGNDSGGNVGALKERCNLGISAMCRDIKDVGSQIERSAPKLLRDHSTGLMAVMIEMRWRKQKQMI
jgi:hypothetical protein